MQNSAELTFVLLSGFVMCCPESPFWRGSFLPGGQEKREESVNITVPPVPPAALGRPHFPISGSSLTWLLR